MAYTTIALGPLLNHFEIKDELENKIKSTDIAYYIGPCINASGRIGDPFLGFNLLVKNEKKELETIAEKLINSNNERKTLENISYNQAKGLLQNLKNMKFIFLYSKTWHPGIIGIMASRLVQEFKVPAFVMNIDENSRILSVKVAAGGIASCPIRLSEVEDVLLGSTLDESDVRKATEICIRYVTAPADVHATVEYRKGLTCRLLAKALVQAKETAKKGFIG